MKFSWPGIKNAPVHVILDGPMLKEEVILIKERLTKDDLTTFPNKKTWFESFKQTYWLLEMRNKGEADNYCSFMDVY